MRGAGRGESTAGAGGDRAARFAERMQNMPPEQRERMLERMRQRGFDPTSTAAGGAGASPSTQPTANRPRTAAAPAPPSRPAGATTIDALFGPLPRVESAGRVWLYVNQQLQPLRVRLGISDGQNTELIEGDLQPSAEVVTNVSTGTETRPPATNAFPFGQPGRAGGFPGGGFPAGGGTRTNGGGRGGGAR